MSSTKAIKAGKATATYRADATVSNMAFENSMLFSAVGSATCVREDERPDNWLCQATFENRSSFAVDLTKLQVSMKR